VLFYEIIRNELAANLKKQLQETVGKKILEDQFAIAEKIQKLLIPPEDHLFNNIAISCFYRAASGVGGDYYDYFEIDKSNIALIVSDVSGKGISGAFVMVNVRSIFQHNITKFEMNPAEMVKIINSKMVHDSTDDIFATLSVYIFNCELSQLTFCNAGYGPFAYYSSNEKRIIEIPSSSLPSGVTEDCSQYKNEIIALTSGDIVISYTDGLLEGLEKKLGNNGKQALYLLLKDHAHESPKGIKNRIIDEIRDLIENQEQQDDISLIISKVI
jgi:serine phosphatase RsbU (regulator of sigma subunit)